MDITEDLHKLIIIINFPLSLSSYECKQVYWNWSIYKYTYM